MTPNDLDMVKVKNINMHATYTAKAQIYIRFTLRWAIFELWHNLRKSAPNDPKWPWHVQGQKYQHACYIHPQGPNFQSALLYDEPFLSCGLIFVEENSHLVDLKKLSSTPGGRNWANFCSTGTSFQDTAWFSKLAYLGMKLGNWPKLHIYFLSTPGGRNWAYFRSKGSGFLYTGQFLKIAIFGHETWPLAKVAQILSFCPKGSNFHSMGSHSLVSEILTDFQTCHIWPWNFAIGQSARSCTYRFFLPQGGRKNLYERTHMRKKYLRLFSLYAQRFSRYGPIFKIAIFGHETLPLAKVPEVAHNTLFLP